MGSLNRVRSESWNEVQRLGLPVNPNLPELDEVRLARSQSDVEDRLLCMLAAAAAAYGLPSPVACAWLQSQNLWEVAAPQERVFLQDGAGDQRIFKAQIEGMWALAWALSLVRALDFEVDCPNSFVSMLPDLHKADSVAAFRSTTRLRPVSEVSAKLDLAYCLHWAVRQLALEGKRVPLRTRPFVVRERRRALEWLTNEGGWYEVELDT
jgi:hypothetical protein